MQLVGRAAFPSHCSPEKALEQRQLILESFIVKQVPPFSHGLGTHANLLGFMGISQKKPENPG
jgi:hypothetical protein